MIEISLKLQKNHISEFSIVGHANIFPVETSPSTKASTKTGLFKKKTSPQQESMGSIPCAGISILAKSFIESIILYAQQRKLDLDNFMQVLENNQEGNLKVTLMEPNSDPLHIHRYAIEQMFIIGIQALAKEYPNEVQLKIKNK